MFLCLVLQSCIKGTADSGPDAVLLQACNCGRVLQICQRHTCEICWGRWRYMRRGTMLLSEEHQFFTSPRSCTGSRANTRQLQWLPLQLESCGIQIGTEAILAQTGSIELGCLSTGILPTLIISCTLSSPFLVHSVNPCAS